MPVIKVYHNPNFLDYRGNHSDIVPPTRPVATVQGPEGIPIEQAAEFAFRQTQHVDVPWWDNGEVTLHARSTSVGDVLEVCPEPGQGDEQGNLFVVESMGFRPLRPGSVQVCKRSSSGLQTYIPPVWVSAVNRV